MPCYNIYMFNGCICYIVVVVCTILVGGTIVGCYFISQKNNKDKE